jgi:hypothetical protein
MSDKLEAAADAGNADRQATRKSGKLSETFS